jgi:hypothetical protein
MGKPTEEELKKALAEASRMREQGDDPNFVAKTLLNTYYRCKYLEKVLHATEHFLHSGQAVTEHTQLIKAIEEYRAIEMRTSGEDDEYFSLIST